MFSLYEKQENANETRKSYFHSPTNIEISLEPYVYWTVHHCDI